MKYKTCVFIGRFQPVHQAHIQTIQKALELAETVIIAVGTAKRARTIKNPWSTQERIEMIKLATNNNSNIKFIEVRDHKYNNTKWASEIYSKALLAGATQDKRTALIGSFKDDSSFYLNMFPQWSLETLPLVRTNAGNILSATDIRNNLFGFGFGPIYNDYLAPAVIKYIKDWKNTLTYEVLAEEYRYVKEYKRKWESAPFQPTFVTVDNVVVKSGHILLVMRGHHPGKGCYALPGGFLNPGERIRDAALRELKEETRIKVDKIILERSIEDSQVFDHPDRSVRGRTITHSFLINLGEGPLPEVKADDDAIGANWIPLADLQSLEDKMFEDHMDIITYMTSRF